MLRLDAKMGEIWVF